MHTHNYDFYDLSLFLDNGVKRAQINNAIAFMIAKDGLPLNTVEKVGFNYLIKVLAPGIMADNQMTTEELLRVLGNVEEDDEFSEAISLYEDDLEVSFIYDQTFHI